MKVFQYFFMLFTAALICLLTHCIGYGFLSNKVLNYNDISFMGWIGTIIWYGFIFSAAHVMYMQYLEENK